MVFGLSAGANKALGPFVFRIINILSFANFPLNDMLTVFPIQMQREPCRTCFKIGEGHHRVMIDIRIVVLQASVLRAKFC